MSSQEYKRKRINKIAVLILIIFLLISFLCAVCYLAFNLYSEYAAEKSYENILDFATDTLKDEVQSEEILVENPIDFASLKEKNNEVYAWIRIPETNIDYPVVQSKIDDNFYLNRSIDKKYLFAGMIYSQSCNNLDFFDPITVLYGHNMKNGTMFQNLHKFQDAKFFEENDEFYVYTQNRIFTYKVISAFKFDNRHIMNSYDFNDKEQLAEFQNTILNPNSLIKNVRSDIKLNEYSKVLVCFVQ